MNDISSPLGGAEAIDVPDSINFLMWGVPDALGNAYNRTRFIDDRVAMMQAWADYLDRLKAGAEVGPIRLRGT